jgi:hypothetical protein
MAVPVSSSSAVPEYDFGGSESRLRPNDILRGDRAQDEETGKAVRGRLGNVGASIWAMPNFLILSGLYDWMTLRVDRAELVARRWSGGRTRDLDNDAGLAYGAVVIPALAACAPLACQFLGLWDRGGVGAGPQKDNIDFCCRFFPRPSHSLDSKGRATASPLWGLVRSYSVLQMATEFERFL